MKTKLILILTVLLAGCNLAIAQSPYATRLPAELQTAQMDSLADVTWLQGTTPAIRVEPLLRGRPVAVDADTTVRMVIGPSATGTLYAARTNLAAVTNAYEIQWPTIGTNSAGAAWFYTLLFDRAGYTYWSGSGKLYIEETTSTASNGLEWIEYTTPNVGWANIVGDPGDNAALVQYVADHGGGSAEDTVARAGVATNAADIAIMQTGKLDVATAATTYQPVGDYATGTPLYVETYLGTITGATITGGTVTTNSGVLEFTVEGGSGISAAEAGQIATNVASGYLPLAGHNGPVVLGTRTRGYAASTNLGEFGFAAGLGTSAGYAGFAAGLAAKGADGSFVFADNSAGWTPFNRTNRPNEFAARAAGGVYFDTPLMVVTGTVSAGSITLGGVTRTNWPEGGTGTGATQLIANIQGQAARTSTYDAGTATLTLADLPAPEGGGGGTADPFSSILVSADWTWTNGIYAVGANTSVTNIAITLPDAGTNFASVVVRKFSNLNQLLVVRGTNVVYTLYDDGSTRSYDWWPQHTNWYWRN